MRISKLYLHNVKCYDEVEVDFSEEDSIALRNRTIILGNNGTGKSTVLKSIALLLAGSSSLGEILGEPNDWIKIGEAECRLELRLLTEKSEERIISLVFELDDTLKKIIDRNRKSLDLLDDAVEHTKRNYLTIGYGVYRRVGAKAAGSSKGQYEHDRSNNIATLFDSDSYLYPFESWVMDLDYRHGIESLTQIKKAINKLLPDAEFDHIDKERSKVVFKTKNGLVDFNQLSDGFQMTANWLGDLLYRVSSIYEDYKNPLNAEFVLLIDEIALHLHPSWQREVIISISKLLPNAQIIATTHSPFVAQQAKSGELYTIVKSESKKLDLFHYTNDPRKLLIHQILMSDIFGLTTDESVTVERAKNKIRKDPDTRIYRTNSRKNLSGAKALGDLKNIDSVEDIPISDYPNEQLSDVKKIISTFKEELNKIENDKT